MNPTPSPIRERMAQLASQMSTQLYEKESIVRLALLAAIAGESIFLLGPPGVAKSMIARRLKYAFAEAKSFEYLMGKFSTPDEVFGPVSISRLKNQDKYERLTDKYLPGANVVFLDEIWKASPPIQNSLLTVLNEKIYRNGEQEIRVDLRGLIAASNELPLSGESLEALWDRFLIRLLVENIEDESLFNEMISLPKRKEYSDPVAQEVKITDEEYEHWGEQINEIFIPNHVLGLVNHLRRSIRQRNSTASQDQQMYVSDRRWGKIMNLLRTSAFLHGRKEVHVMDCFVMQDCLWDQIEQIAEAKDLVLGSIAAYGYARLVPLEPIRQQLSKLQEEIQAETQEVLSEEVQIKKIYRDKAGNPFFCLTDLWSRSKGYLRLGDFEKVQEEGQANLPVMEETGRVFRLSQTYPFAYENDHQLRYQDRLIQLETEAEERETIQVRPASEGHRKLWDTEIHLMLEFCEQGLEEVEARKQQDEPHVSDHLFVENNYAEHVMDSLQSTTHELLNLKLEIEKLQHSYESLQSD
ncbi:MAG: AAA family ATPase [Bacteroidota bacterium]